MLRLWSLKRRPKLPSVSIPAWISSTRRWLGSSSAGILLVYRRGSPIAPNVPNASSGRGFLPPGRGRVGSGGRLGGERCAIPRPWRSEHPPPSLPPSPAAPSQGGGTHPPRRGQRDHPE